MTTADMATKLGFTYTKKKELCEGNNGGAFYTRTNHILTPIAGGQPLLFRDGTSVTLFLESKAQLEIPGTRTAKK